MTRTPGGNAQDESLPYRVLRQPTTATLIRQVVASDVVQLNTWSIPVALVAGGGGAGPRTDGSHQTPGRVFGGVDLGGPGSHVSATRGAMPLNSGVNDEDAGNIGNGQIHRAALTDFITWQFASASRATWPTAFVEVQLELRRTRFAHKLFDDIPLETIDGLEIYCFHTQLWASLEGCVSPIIVMPI